MDGSSLCSQPALFSESSVSEEEDSERDFSNGGNCTWDGGETFLDNDVCSSTEGESECGSGGAVSSIAEGDKIVPIEPDSGDAVSVGGSSIVEIGEKRSLFVTESEDLGDLGGCSGIKRWLLLWWPRSTVTP